MFNSLLENINRRNRSYDLIGQQPVRPQIQRISPVNITPEVQNVPMPISPGLSAVTAQSLAPPTAQVPDPVAQELPLPQSQGLTPPVAQELPLPQSQGLTPPVAQEMGPPQPMELDLPKEITSTDLAQGAVAAIKQGGIQGGDEGAAQGFGQWMQKVASDDEAMGSIILALNSLRTKPDANLATAMREQISASRKQRKETATKNRTLEVLKGLPGVTDEIMKIAEVDPLAAIKMAIEKKKDRKTLEDAAGYKRYQDTGERVFPGAEKKKDRKTLEDAAGYKRYADTGERVFPDIDVPVDDSKNAYQAKSFALPDGTVVTGSFNPRAKPGSQFVDRAGNPLPMGARIISTQAQGTPDELGLTTSTQTSLEKQHIAMTSLERGLVQMQKILKQDPSVVGTKGQYSKYVGGALGQFEFTKPMIDMLNTSPELKQQYDSLGKSIVGQVSTLLQDDPSRKSDKDIQMAMDAMQTDSWISSPEQATVALRTLMKVVAEKKADVGNRLNPTDLKTKYNHLLKKGE